MRRLVYILSFFLILSACSNSVRFSSDNNNNKKKTKTKYSPDSPKKQISFNNNIENESLSEQLVSYSKNWLGVPYRYGGNTTDGIDCSGFIKNIFHYIGYNLPRTAQQQYDFTRKIPEKNVKQGDLAFFRRRGKIFHVGLYIGDNKIIHSSSSKGVIIQDLSDSWLKSNFYSFGRIDNQLHSSK